MCNAPGHLGLIPRFKVLRLAALTHPAAVIPFSRSGPEQGGAVLRQELLSALMACRRLSPAGHRVAPVPCTT